MSSLFKMATQKIMRWTLVVLLIMQTACIDQLMSGLFGSAANTVLNSGMGSPSTPGSSSTGGSNATDDGLLDSGDDDDGLQLPQASIPLPPGLENSTLSSADSQGIMVAQGSVGSDFSGMSLVISSQNTAHNSQFEGVSRFFTQAMATEATCPEDMTYLACVTVSEDGTYHTSIATASEGETLEYFIYDPESGLLSEPVTETANTHLVHVGHSIASITSDNEGHLYGVSEDGSLVTLEYDSEDSTIRVTGDSEDNYTTATLENGASQIAFNTNASSVVALSEGVLQEYSIDGSSVTATEFSSGNICDALDGCHATNLKYVDGEIFYGAEFDEGHEFNRGVFFELYDINADESFEFRFMAEDFALEDLGAHSNLKSVKTLDVYSDATLEMRNTVGVMENLDGHLRLFSKFDDLGQLPLTFPTKTAVLEAEHSEIIDIKVLDEQTGEDLSDGRGFLLSNAGVTFFDFDSLNLEDEASGFTMGSTLAIENAVSMAVSSDRTVGYVLSSNDTESSDDDIITVVDLTEEAIKTSVGTNGVIQLSAYFADKTVMDLSPTAINFFTKATLAGPENYVVVSLGNTNAAFENSALVIAVE